MNSTFPVDWRQAFRHHAISLAIKTAIGVTGMMIFHYLGTKNPSERVSFSVFLLILLIATPLISIPIAYWNACSMRGGAITIADGFIHGRGAWYRGTRIPLSDITRIKRFSKYGVDGFTVCSRSHGKIHITEHMERLRELLEFLALHVPEKERASAVELMRFIPA
jgi:hypothetical protein